MSVAGDVRKMKEQNPEKYCHDPKCLWRVVTCQGIKPCPKHPVSFAGPRFDLVEDANRRSQQHANRSAL